MTRRENKKISAKIPGSSLTTHGVRCRLQVLCIPRQSEYKIDHDRPCSIFNEPLHMPWDNHRDEKMTVATLDSNRRDASGDSSCLFLFESCRFRVKSWVTRPSAVMSRLEVGRLSSAGMSDQTVPITKPLNIPRIIGFSFQDYRANEITKARSAECRSCGRTVKEKAGTTSNFLRHLRKHHPDLWVLDIYDVLWGFSTV